jgi:hypothetical protein
MQFMVCKIYARTLPQVEYALRMCRIPGFLYCPERYECGNSEYAILSPREACPLKYEAQKYAQS